MSEIYHDPGTSLFGKWSLLGLRPTATLARWRLRRTWPLLIVTGVGMLAAVMLICCVPLLSQVAMTAGLREVLTANADSNVISLTLNNQGLSTQIAGDIQKQLDPYFQQNVGPYLNQAPVISTDVAGVHFVTPALPPKSYILDLFATSIAQAASHITLTQGQLPGSSLVNNEVPVLITPEAAQNLHIGVNSLVTLSITYAPKVVNLNLIPDNLPTATLKARVTGLFHTNGDPFWQGKDFLPAVSDAFTGYTVLVPDTALYSAYDQIAAANHSDGVFSPLLPFSYSMSYTLDASKVTIDQLGDLQGRLAGVQLGLSNRYGTLESGQLTGGISGTPVYPYLEKLAVASPMFTTFNESSTLDKYSNHVAVARIPVLILVIQLIVLILFFVSVMTGLLVDRQTETIAVIRSRGGSGLQIFGALLTQGIGLSVLAFIIGPLLALFVSEWIAPLMLSANQQDAVSSISANPAQSLSLVLWYAGVTVLAAIVAMALMLLRAARMDVLSVRREAARTGRRPFWQRLHLDVVAGVIALVGYLVSIYLTSIASLLDSRTRTLISEPLTLVGPLFLFIGSMLLFLRIFPYLLRFGAWLAVRGRGATPILALAQMARAPQQAVRMTMLLALATAFIIFTLIFTASQMQRQADLASYEAGADFSGVLSTSTQLKPIKDITDSYRNIPGVNGASAGYTVKIDEAGVNAIPLEVRAVDSDTFATAAIWPSQASAQSLSSLMALLRSQRAAGIRNDTVPVIVDAVMQNKMLLHKGSTFSLNINALRYSELRCVVVDVVAHIPTVNDSQEVGEDPSYSPPGGLLLDYQTYSAVYKNDVRFQFNEDGTLPINHIWLSTASDQTSLTNVRTALTGSTLRLGNLYDRRALAEGLNTDPLYLNLVVILALGTITALLLALVGDLLASWLSARVRVSNFAVLRALGTTPGQVMSVLTWEQGTVYITALLLGLIFGALLSISMIPVLTFNSAPARGNLSSLSNGEFYALQHVLPTTIVVPQTLLIASAALVVLCILALVLMVRVVSQPELNRVLRVSQD